jgi:hypothetical protein
LRDILNALVVPGAVTVRGWELAERFKQRAAQVSQQPETNGVWTLTRHRPMTLVRRRVSAEVRSI